MEPRPGCRVRARGLTWDVVDADGVEHRERIVLRCVDGDMAGLEWEVYVPPEQIELIDATFDFQHPAPLPLWHLMHRAHVLNNIPDGPSFVARQPGRLRVEPYQMVPVIRALDMPRPRLLLADGVGLGKTIQAGLIATELIARRRAHRILIVAPSGPLLAQWEQETRLRFGLKFTPVTNAADLWDVRRAHELGANPFDIVSLCITAMDFAKQDYVLEELERSAWDLVIIDEAHHCAAFGTHENTQRRRLAEVLARRCDGLLLLTATPHDGDEAHFASLIALLDPSLVDGAGGLIGRAYRRHVVRRMKAHIRDPITGAPLFRKRRVLHVKVDTAGPEHDGVREFHRALSAFVVPRLRQRPGSDDALAFVTLLKRSVSTISACLETLRVVMERLARHEAGDVETKAERRERAKALRAWRRRAARFGSLGAQDEANQAAMEIESMAEALRTKPDSEPARLIRLGEMAEAHDPKLSAMILEVRLIRLHHPRANILIYTEYTDSQLAAARLLRSEGEVLTIGGQDDDQARADAARRFSESDGMILVSTDSLAEGLNLHRYCFHLIHLDLPYNPNRLEQRNGRIDRYGQQHEPEIRYLYIPNTFEESLLLHLISKYEKARSSLDVMPDTLGVTADPDDYGTSLTKGMSEDLFEAGVETIRTLDRAVSDSQPEVVAELMRDMDRAFNAFDMMAVCHGWYGGAGLNAGSDVINQARQLSFGTVETEDLANFVGDVIEAESSNAAMNPGELQLPTSWSHGLTGLPGIEPTSNTLRFTRDCETYGDAAGRITGFLGRAHPLVLRAIRHGCRLPGAIAAGRGERPGLLLTFEIEIAELNRVAFREIIAVLAEPDCPPVAIDDWLFHGTVESAISDSGSWDRLFASWAAPALLEANALAGRIAAQRRELFDTRYESAKQREMARSQQWLRTRADLLCGPFVPPTGDLFGGPAPGPVWRSHEDPMARLISFAIDRDVPGSKRREADEVLRTYRETQSLYPAPGAVVSRPIGILMLVPADAA